MQDVIKRRLDLKGRLIAFARLNRYRISQRLDLGYGVTGDYALGRLIPAVEYGGDKVPDGCDPYSRLPDQLPDIELAGFCVG